MATLRPDTADAVNGHYKDTVLARLAEHANVAQFVSFSPGDDPRIRHVSLHGEARLPRASVGEAVRELLARSTERSVNVRAFDPEQPKSHEFLYGLVELKEVVSQVSRLARDGLYTIVNETIDVNDGGVSGVAYAGLIEFAPGDTPRCVEKPGTVSFPRDLGLRVLETVYGVRPELDQPDDVRTEFSIHPLKRGVRHSHTVLWEEERTEAISLEAEIVWPNKFSRFLGDKAFGLLVADAIGLAVPQTTAIPRRLAPFSFGRPTGSGERWVRTCPLEPVPGRFTTKRGWLDPFLLLASEDRDSTLIASVLAQEGVDAEFAGAAGSSDRSQSATIEGVRGTGEAFMLGRLAPERLPAGVVADVEDALRHAAKFLGPVRLEWVHDGDQAWVVQLQRGATPAFGRVIYPGRANVQHRFPVEGGLEALRELAQRLEGTGEGVIVVGQVGVTSHIGDVLRRVHIPSRIEWTDPDYETPHPFET